MDVETILSSIHGRQRRQEREIAKRSLRSCVKHGKKEPAGRDSAGGQRWKYTFSGVVFITDASSTREITSWLLPAYGIDLDKYTITSAMRAKHRVALEKLKDRSTWTSHCVVVVDQSGSMRNTDASEGVTRSDLAWLTLALELVASNLTKGERQDTDVLSVVAMREGAQVVIICQPYDWVLYNSVVDLLRTSEPSGPGCYIPSLKAARDLLNSNEFEGCALEMILLSDGRPSDKLPPGNRCGYFTLMKRHAKTYMEEIASRLGNRFTFGAIALGQPGCDDFSTLQTLSKTAKQYSRGCFQRASLSAGVLTNALSSLNDSVSMTMKELTDAFGRQRRVRKFVKEPLENIGGTKITRDWEYIKMEARAVNRPLKRMRVALDDNSFVAHDTSACFRSIVCTRWVKNQGWTPVARDETFYSHRAVGVALKKRWFGEGAERLVKEFREVDAEGTFVGPPMVAKDTKFVLERNEDRKDFHKLFFKTQMKARKLADVFNEKMKRIPGFDPHETPLIAFLDCCVYMLEDFEKGRREGYLVERLLDVKNFSYQKWNDNDGMVKGTKNAHNEFVSIKESLPLHVIYEESSDECDSASDPMQITETESLADTIHENVDYDEDDSVESDDDDSNCRLGRLVFKKRFPGPEGLRVDEVCLNPDLTFSVNNIPQAFSCFSFWKSRRKFLICDLQGILNTSKSPPVFELTDPVIHHSASGGKESKYGRTDKGWEGICAFQATHVCSNLCRMLQKRRFIHSENVIKFKTF